MAHISWLHLSDFHQGCPYEAWRWPSAKSAFYEDLARMHEQSGPWDLLLFTGDLTWRGTGEEFERLGEVLTQLLERLEVLGKRPAVLAVPGNHDLVRPNPKSSVVRALLNWDQDKVVRDEFWATESEYRDIVSDAFRHYRTFWNQWQPSSLKVCNGILPGDFSTSFQVGELNLGIVGLNSTFLQLTGDDYNGRLVLDVRQFHAVCAGDGPDWAQKHDAVLLLTHHPVEWLNKEALEHFDEIYHPDIVVAHLFGHMHEQESKEIARFGSNPRRYLQGASLFGVEHIGNGATSRIHGYMSGRIEKDERGMRIRYWPRRAVKKDGVLEIIADPKFKFHDADYAVYEISPRRTFNRITDELDRFVRRFRKSLAHIGRWWEPEVGVIGNTHGLGQEHHKNFDDGYHPLRIRRGAEQVRDIHELLNLLQQERRIVVYGSGGSGKTTWLQATFRQLLEISNILPVFVRLSEIAVRWQNPACMGEARSLEAYVEDWGAELAREWKSHWHNIFDLETAPVPILLIDAWDELGGLGLEMFTKLSIFLERYPRVRVIVTSRYDGLRSPFTQAGFATFALEPLSRNEFADFATRIMSDHASKDTLQVELGSFLRDLQASPAAIALARTPLLFSLMMGVHYEFGLLDKRHQLYERCIQQLLTTGPRRKLMRGAIPPDQVWRPGDPELRMQIVATLAARLHAKIDHAEGEVEHSAMIGSLDELAALLPESFPDQIPDGFDRKSARIAFILWLWSSAGILIRRAEGYCFASVAFQDYLTAWYLDKTITDDRTRTEAFREKSAHPHWWEILTLWANIIHGYQSTRINPILEGLLQKGRAERVALAGVLLANGCGEDGHLQRWFEPAMSLAAGASPGTAGPCVIAWRTSRHEERRRSFAAQLGLEAAKSGLMNRISYERWADACGFPPLKPGPAPGTLAADIVAGIRAEKFDTAREVVAGRILCKLDAHFDGLHLMPEVALLSVLWPSQRARVGYVLQLLNAYGASRSELERHARVILQSRVHASIDSIFNDKALMAQLYMGGRIRAEMDHERDPDAVAAISVSMDRVIRGDARDYLSALAAKEEQRDRARSGIWGDIVGTIETIASTARFIGELVAGTKLDELVQKQLVKWLVTDVEFGDSSPWLSEFALVLMASAFTEAVRHRLLLIDATNIVIIACAAQAYRISVTLVDDAKVDQFLDFLDKHQSLMDPLWPALARHIVGRSTDADQRMLIDLASHPEKRDGILGLALKYVVRGDVLMDDGSEIGLDQLSAQFGLDPLAYLENAPSRLMLSAEDLERARPLVEAQIRSYEFGKKIARSRPKWSFDMK